MNIDLMELADCGSPERLVGAILRANPDLPVPVPIEELARAVGIEQIARRDTEGFEGVLVTNPEKSRGSIAVSARSSRTRQRFTIAHEVGHFLIPSHTGRMECTSRDLAVRTTRSPEKRRESEANRFAAQVLMPAPSFRRDMREPSIEHLSLLAKRYVTSLEATANRYCELAAERCAVVFSRRGLVRYARTARRFPWLNLRQGEPLPDGSLSAVTRSLPGEPSEWVPLNQEVWFPAWEGRPLGSVLEQTLVQRNGYQLTLLLVEDEDAFDEEEAEEEEQLIESWTPRFRR